MKARRVVACAVLASCVTSCGETGEPAAPVKPVNTPKIIVTTLSRDFDPLATRHDATWAAVEKNGVWTALAPTAPGTGTYEVDATGAPWAIAIACADEDDALTSLMIHRRAATTTSLSIVLDRQCAGLVDAHTLNGTLTNLPPQTAWFDFGYVDGSRGLAIPPDLARFSYELVNVFDGTWDLAFGVRTSPGAPYSRVAILRGEIVATDHVLDVDMAGAASFTTSTKKLLVRNMTAEENLDPVIRYAAGGVAAGIDVGPVDVPSVIPDVALTYETFPPAAQRPSDRYRGTLTALHGKDKDRDPTARTAAFSFHDAIDVDVTLPAPLPPPEASFVSSGAPRVVVRARVLATAGVGAKYTVRATSRMGRRQEHTWGATFDAETAGAVIDHTMPDLTKAAGYRERWSLPVGEPVDVVAIVDEAARPLGDGTLERSSTSIAYLTPP